jgi:hypothetical protein
MHGVEAAEGDVVRHRQGVFHIIVERLEFGAFRISLIGARQL